MTYGIFDKTDNCWIGNDDGPKLFRDFMIARIAAQMVETQVFGTDMGARYEAKEFVDGQIKLRGKVEAKLTPLKALRRLETTNDGSKIVEMMPFGFDGKEWKR